MSTQGPGAGVRMGWPFNLLSAFSFVVFSGQGRPHASDILLHKPTSNPKNSGPVLSLPWALRPTSLSPQPEQRCHVLGWATLYPGHSSSPGMPRQLTLSAAPQGFPTNPGVQTPLTSVSGKVA